ncbi:MAG: amino acid--tRNA ligase-related protein, partial [Actinomycetota bacterium]
MRERHLVKNLAAMPDGPVVVGGWVEKLRDQKRIQFIIVRDESGDVQVTYPRPADEDALADQVSTLTAGSFVWIKGRLVHDERVKLGGLEIQLDELEIVTLADPETPIADDTSIDKRLDWRFLDMRRPEMNLVFKVQTTIEAAWRKWWVENGFTEIHSPKLMASASESNAELFRLEYFDTVAYLAQSPQFYKQMAMMAGLGRIFEIGPVFRADPSFTSRHATEFVSVDMEVSWIDSHEDIMDIQEELMVTAITAVKEAYGEEIKRLFDVEVVIPTRPFPRIPLAEAIEIVKGRGHEVARGGDMDPEGERQI